MKIAVAIFRENDGVPFRKTIFKNVNDEADLDEAIETAAEFMEECFDEINEEALYDR